VDEPHITGRRIGVRQRHALVEERELSAETVADRYDLDIAVVYHALAYYHDGSCATERFLLGSQPDSRRWSMPRGAFGGREELAVWG
jgi:uncharacterized protein (DUF433 family)